MDLEALDTENGDENSNIQSSITLEDFEHSLNELNPAFLETLSVEQRLEHELSTWSNLSYYLRRNRASLSQELAKKVAQLSWTLFDPYTSMTLLHRQRAVVEALARDPFAAHNLLYLSSQAPLNQIRTLRFLNMVLPRISSSAILDVLPDLIPNCLATYKLGDHLICSLVSRLLLGFVPNLSSNTTFDDQSCADSIAELLLDPISREGLSNQLLKPLLQARPSLINPLLKASQNNTACTPYSIDAYSAILVVFNALPLSFQGGIERDILTAALESSSVELRSSAVLCLTSNRSSDSIHDRISLILKFLHHNIGDHSPSMRNTLITCLWPIFRQICCNNRSTQSSLDTFFTPLISIISNALSPHRPYRFRINSIKILETLMDFLHKTSNSDLTPILNIIRFKSDISVLLLMGLLDSYDDVQRTSSSLLSRYNKVFTIKSSHRQWLVSLAVSLMQAQKESDSDAGTLVLDLIRDIRITQSNEKITLPLPSSTPEPAHVTNKSSQLYLLDQLVAFAEHLSNLTESDLAAAATETPIHGTLQSLAKIIEKLDLKNDNQYDEYQKHFRRCLSIVDRVWNASSRILCNAAPEGAEATTDHEESRAMLLTNEDTNPQISIEAGVSDDESKHKVVMSACWRSVTSAGNLLEKIFSTPARAGCDILKEIWSFEDIDSFGKTYASWLLNVRHRGAFSSIYPCYLKLCASISALKGTWDEVAVLPESWLNSHVDHMLTHALSTTRRSAGLPFCVLAVLVGTLNKYKHLSSKIGTRLLEAAEKTEDVGGETAEIARIHIMNTLKTLFADAKVGNALEACVEATFSLAIRNYRSSNWGVRNASTMLFAMLVQRTVGHNRNTSPSAPTRSIPAVNFFKRFPSLRDVLHKELIIAIKEDEYDNDQYKTMESYNRLYSILLLLSFLRSIESVTAVEHNRIKIFIEPIEHCVSNRVWKIREVVAQAYASFTLPRNVADACDSQLQPLLKCCESKNYNEIHGRLLIILMLLRNDKITSVNIWSFAKKLEQNAPWFLDSRRPPTIRTTVIDIFIEVINHCKSEARVQAFKSEFTLLQDCIYKCQSTLNVPSERVTGDLMSYFFGCARFCLSLDIDKYLNIFLNTSLPDLTLLVVRHLSTQPKFFLPNNSLQTLSRLAYDSNCSELLQETILTYAASDLKLAKELASMTSFVDVESRYRNAVTVPLREALLIPLSMSPRNEKELLTALDILDDATCPESTETTRVAACKALLLFVQSLQGLESSQNSKYVRKKCELLTIRVLQDDDEDIRDLAETVASTLSLLSDDTCKCGDRSTNILEKSLTKQNVLALESIWPSLLDSYDIDDIISNFILTPAELSLQTLQLNETKLFPVERANLYEDDEGNLEIIQRYLDISTDACNQENRSLSPDSFPVSYRRLKSLCERLDSLDMKIAIRNRLGTLLWTASCVITAYRLIFPENSITRVDKLEQSIRRLRHVTEWSDDTFDSFDKL